jgi:hypothetical protein
MPEFFLPNASEAELLLSRTPRKNPPAEGGGASDARRAARAVDQN